MARQASDFASFISLTLFIASVLTIASVLVR